eukprot:CAMPEP_0176483216 /NCGR_PEP_ID=MMETSP0200_2-20121128/3801_1 /TAXON_ID=947934 /ORGANISM="Chaetoceros sp., Strain GSL56" /LENGTH=256 /DNA_ID=CAMNT_0017879605 /DNA_START=126 /DNA_END=896 /DNA_ORIENTATION=+
MFGCIPSKNPKHAKPVNYNNSEISSHQHDPQPHLEEAKNRMKKSNTALLMIDFQRDFCSPSGYADAAFEDAGQEWVESIIPKAQQLLKWARDKNLLIIHTREGYSPDLSDVSESKSRKAKANNAAIGKHGPLGRLLIRGEYGQDTIDELAALPEEIILDKSSFGTFCTTNLDFILRQAGIEQVILAGVTADVCVHTTLREATDRGYECWYVRDAISTPDPFLREACERMVVHEGGIWGWLVTVDEITKLGLHMTQL